MLTMISAIAAETRCRTSALGSIASKLPCASVTVVNGSGSGRWFSDGRFPARGSFDTGCLLAEA
jgi:hypothetical protein